jgi:hypothetical protein
LLIVLSGRTRKRQSEEIIMPRKDYRNRAAPISGGSRLPTAFVRVVACTIFLLASCATPYQPQGHRAGYTDQRIDESTYVVSYRGDGTTDAERAWNFWMYRCAELTLEKGFAYFSILPKARLTGDFTAPTLRPAVAYSGGSGELVHAKGGGVTYYTYSVPYTYTVALSSATIKLHREPLPAHVLIAINAAKLKELLAPVVAGKPRELSRQALLASAMIFNDKARLANLDSATDTPFTVHNMEELRVIASRDFVPAMLRSEVAANTAPVAKKFASPKRRLEEMTILAELALHSDGSKKQAPGTVVEQHVRHPDGYTTITHQTTLGANTAPTSFGAEISIGGIFSVRSAYTASPLLSKTAYSFRYGDQYVVQAMSGELAKPVGTISLTKRSLVDKNGVERRFSSESAISTISCDVDETKPASSLHPNLQGNALRMTCKSTFGSRPTSESTRWFLEDYQWYVVESEKWATGSSTRTIVGVR